MTKTKEIFFALKPFYWTFFIGYNYTKKHEISFIIWLRFIFSITSANIFFLLEQLIDMPDHVAWIWLANISQSHSSALVLAKRYKDFDLVHKTQNYCKSTRHKNNQKCHCYKRLQELFRTQFKTKWRKYTSTYTQNPWIFFIYFFLVNPQWRRPIKAWLFIRFKLYNYYYDS